MVERTSDHVGRSTSFISCLTLATNSGACLIDWRIPRSFFAGLGHGFSTCSSDKGHSSFRGLPSCQLCAMRQPSVTVAGLTSAWLKLCCWRSAGERGRKPRLGRDGEVFNIKPVADSSGQEQEHKQDRQGEHGLRETVYAQRAGDGEDQDQGDRNDCHHRPREASDPTPFCCPAHWH